MSRTIKYRSVTFVITEKVETFDGDDRTNAEIIKEAWNNIVDRYTNPYLNTSEFRSGVSGVIEVRED